MFVIHDNKHTTDTSSFLLTYSIFNNGDEYATCMIIVLSLHMNNNWVIMGILPMQTTVQLRIGSSPMMTLWVKKVIHQSKLLLNV